MVVVVEEGEARQARTRRRAPGRAEDVHLLLHQRRPRESRAGVSPARTRASSSPSAPTCVDSSTARCGDKKERGRGRSSRRAGNGLGQDGGKAGLGVGGAALQRQRLRQRRRWWQDGQAVLQHRQQRQPGEVGRLHSRAGTGLDSAGDQIPNRPTRGFHSYPSGYTAVLTEEEESNGRYLTTQHNHRLPDVSEQSVGSADNLQTVVEVNSNSAAQQPRPRLLAAWTTTTAPPEIQFTDDQGDVIYPCADSGDSDADSDAASDECAVGELNDDKSDDTGGRGGAGGKGRPSSDRRRSEPATRNRQSPRGRRLSESSARSPPRAFPRTSVTARPLATRKCFTGTRRVPGYSSTELSP